MTVDTCLRQVLVEDYVVFKAQWQYTYGYVLALALLESVSHPTVNIAWNAASAEMGV